MKKNLRVLILAWDFPPYTGIGGARPFSWYKFLKKFEIHPVIITRHWDPDNNYKDSYLRSSKQQTKKIHSSTDGTLIRVPYRENFRDKILIKFGYERLVIFRKALSFFYFLFSFPFFSFDNKKAIYKASKDYLSSNKIDYIIATGEPFILHKYAFLLSKKFGIPYILDYRDGWTTRDDNLELKGFFKFLNEFYFRKFEKKYLKNSSMVTSANPFEGPKIKNISPNIKLENILNGFLEEDIQLGKGVEQLSDYFRIAYAGTIYPFNCVEDFLEGLVNFLKEFPKAKFKLMLLGIENQPDQLNRIKNYNTDLLQYIESSERMSKKDLITWFCKCNCLLVFTSPTTKLLPSKIYEYFALKRKILVSINDKSDVETLINETNAGYNCNNSNEIKNALKEMYIEFSENGFVGSTTVNFQQFSRDNQTKKLATLIKKIN